MAKMMITQMGMSENLGQVAWSSQGGQSFVGQQMGQPSDCSDATSSAIDDEVKSLVDRAYRSATSSRPHLFCFISTLLARSLATHACVKQSYNVSLGCRGCGLSDLGPSCLGLRLYVLSSLLYLMLPAASCFLQQPACTLICAPHVRGSPSQCPLVWS